MRARQLMERYREFAARTHLVMGVFALGLMAAIIALMIVSAVPSQAAFLVAEAQNFVTMAPKGDILLMATVALVFLAVAVAAVLDLRHKAE